MYPEVCGKQWTILEDSGRTDVEGCKMHLLAQPVHKGYNGIMAVLGSW